MKFNNVCCAEYGILLVCVEPSLEYLDYYKIVIKGFQKEVECPSLFETPDSAKEYAETFLKEYLMDLVK